MLSLWVLLSEDEGLLTSPVYSGYVSMLARCLPFNDIDEIQEILQQGIDKELKATQEVYHPISLNWSAVMSDSRLVRHSTPLAEHFPIDGYIHDYIYRGLVAAGHKISSMRLFPDYSKKTIGEIGTKNLNLAVGADDEETYENSTLGLEKMYCRNGVVISGPTECRWAWKYNIIKPRVYYARGPDQYYSSRYIQAIFNVLIDAFEFTHRFHRFDHNSLRFELQDTAFIYDYTAFTSTLFEIRNFTRRVGEFYRGTIVEVVDTHFGLLRLDVGQVIDEFNDACNIFPEFDVGKLNWDRNYSEEILVHNCGMLGVPGNISSCTLLHGIHLACLLRSLIIKVIGDDAFGVGNIAERDSLVVSLSNIGMIAAEKMEFWEPDEESFGDSLDGWHYTKRPIYRLDTRVSVGWQLNFPPIMVLLLQKDSFHTVPLPPETEGQLLKKVASMLTSFSYQAASRELQDIEIQFCEQFMKEIRVHWEWTERCRRVSYPIFCPRVVREGFIEDMIEENWYGTVSIAEEFDGEMLEERPERGFGFVFKMTRSIKVAIDMGYAEKFSRNHRQLVSESVDILTRLFSGRHTASYDIVIDFDCPDWLFDLICNDCTIMPQEEESDSDSTDSD